MVGFPKVVKLDVLPENVVVVAGIVMLCGALIPYPKFLLLYKARHAHKCLYTVLIKYSKIQVLPGITSCRSMKDNKQAIELNDLLKK